MFLGASLIVLTSGAHAKPKSWVQLSIETPTRQYVTGAPIDIMLKAKNTHSAAAFLHFTSGQRFDLQMFRKGSKNPVYTWSATRMFNMMTGNLRLYPNQTQTFDAQIGEEQGAFVPGTYELHAHLTNSSRIEATPVDIEVLASPVQFKATTDKTEYGKDEPIKISLASKNTSGQDKVVSFGSSQTFDVSIRNEEGKEIWSWGANKRFMQALRDVTYKAGETKTFDASWNGRPFPDYTITPGTYTIQAVLMSNPHVYAAPIRITIK